MTTPQGKLISPPILALHYTGGHYSLDTDACEVQVGCILLQGQSDKTKKPIGYWSRSHTEAEIAYDTTRL